MNVLEKLELAEKYGKAESVRAYIGKMTDKCGFIMIPIGLAHLAFEYLQENRPSQNNTILARSLAYARW